MFSQFYEDLVRSNQNQPQRGGAQIDQGLLARYQQQQQQNQQQNQTDWQGMGKLAKYGSNYFKTPAPTDSMGGTYLNGEQGLGYDMGGGQQPSTMFGGNPAPSTPAPSSSSITTSLASNPATWALLAANVAHNKGISPWHETAKGRLGSNLTDYYQKGDHGFMSKILDKDGSVGQSVKGFTDFATGDFGNGLSHMGDSLKNLFKFKLF